ncbi:DNA polymerase IV [Allorhizocola rhizosphaerae]|uniref:DNA polymerase IV n=1 Tax=Allorhizocola rhizosphaerae TaxID=1872709 RepID=UPI00319DA25F
MWSTSDILHVDMDAFFASVEIRRRPALRGLPVVVGGTGNRGVVTSATYEARAFGIRSAMPAMRARALCPHAIFLPGDMQAYAEASRAVMALFREFTPLVEQLSVDEAFLDVSGARRLFGTPEEIAVLIRRRMAAEQQLTCSIGVAPNKFLAKLGSTRAKPDGMIVIPPDGVLEFLHPLPVSALWGVGKRTEESLRRMGLSTVGDVAQASRAMLRAAVGQAAAEHLHELAWGRDSRRVSTERVDKSLGSETTFETDVADAEALRRTILWLSQQVATRARAADTAGRTISVKLRFADFRTITRSRTLHTPTDVAQEIFRTAVELTEAARGGQKLRLIGVRLEGLVEVAGSARQPALDEPEHSWRDAEVATDAVTAKFGRGVVRPASLVKKRPEQGSPARPQT